MKRYLLISLLILFISACGGSSGTQKEPIIEPVISIGNLNMVISGLPDGQSGSVTISGPNGYTQAISDSIILSGLEIGSYSITVNDVTISGISYQGFDSIINLSISANLTFNANISYGALTQSQGVISGFGSVFVNGTRFNTDDAIIITDDTSNGTDTDLDIGMNVSVLGLISADGSISKAAKIGYSALVRGPVEKVNLLNQEITVLGQVILTDELTEFKDTDLASLLAGDIVEISAIVSTDNTLLATLVKKLDRATTGFIVRGEISNIDVVGNNFTLDGLIIDYTTARVEGVLTNGTFVKVKSDAAPINGTLIATQVKVEDNALAHGQFIVIDGIITEVINPLKFKVNKQVVIVADDTKLENGTEFDMILNQRVKVFGQLDENKALIARKIRIDKPGILKVDGHVDLVDAELSTITVLGITFKADNHSHFIDKSPLRIKHFSLSDIEMNDRVQIKAFKLNSEFIIRQLKRTSPEPSLIKLEGIVSNITNTRFELQGVVIITNELTEFEYDDDVSQLEFFSLVTEGDEIEVKGLFQSDGTLLAVKVELEENDEDSNRVEIRGVIDEGFVSSTEFSVNGHAVTTNLATVYKGGTEFDLEASKMIKVKGHQSEFGIILATKIEFKSTNHDDNEVEIAGTVVDFDAEILSFSIRDYNITINENTEFKNGDLLNLTSGLKVEVEGLLINENTILATKIAFKHHDELEIKGVIINFISVTEFMLEHDLAVDAVTTTNQTEFKHGDITMLSNGIRIEVEGNIENNILIARKINFEGAKKVEYEGKVSDFVSEFEFKVDGKAVTTNEFTHFKGGNVTKLKDGIEVEVKGHLDDRGVLVAAKLEFDD